MFDGEVRPLFTKRRHVSRSKGEARPMFPTLYSSCASGKASSICRDLYGAWALLLVGHTSTPGEGTDAWHFGGL